MKKKEKSTDKYEIKGYLDEMLKKRKKTEKFDLMDVKAYLCENYGINPGRVWSDVKLFLLQYLKTGILNLDAEDKSKFTLCKPQEKNLKAKKRPSKVVPKSVANTKNNLSVLQNIAGKGKVEKTKKIAPKMSIKQNQKTEKPLRTIQKVATKAKTVSKRISNDTEKTSKTKKGPKDSKGSTKAIRTFVKSTKAASTRTKTLPKRAKNETTKSKISLKDSSGKATAETKTKNSSAIFERYFKKVEKMKSKTRTSSKRTQTVAMKPKTSTKSSGKITKIKSPSREDTKLTAKIKPIPKIPKLLSTKVPSSKRLRKS